MTSAIFPKRPTTMGLRSGMARIRGILPPVLLVALLQNHQGIQQYFYRVTHLYGKNLPSTYCVAWRIRLEGDFLYFCLQNLLPDPARRAIYLQQKQGSLLVVYFPNNFTLKADALPSKFGFFRPTACRNFTYLNKRKVFLPSRIGIQLGCKRRSVADL